MAAISSAGVGRASGAFYFLHDSCYKPVAPNGALSLLINNICKFNQIVSPLGRHIRMSIVMGVMRSVELMNSCIHSVI